jgi:hypothetical protein
MDRGRVGTLAIGNKTIRDQMIAHQQEVHMERIRKIMTRKAGTGTLDNTAPVIIKAALVNPRKIAKKKEFNIMTEKENRVLLKRISTTLTAPPKITDDEYKAMKKLIGNMKGGKAQYEAAVLARHHKIYLDHLKKMGPYYDPTEWELDYKRQKVQQMFMREVTYERPKGYKLRELPPMKTLGSIHDKNDFKPHFTQLPDYPGRGKVKTNSGFSVSKDGPGQVNRIRNIRDSKDEGSEEKYSEEQFEEDVAGSGGGGGGEDQVELACTHRYIKVQILSSKHDDDGIQENSWGEISCYLLNGSMFLICARLHENGEGKDENSKNDDRRGPEAYEAEAEIDILAIAELRGLDGSLLLESYRSGNVAPIQGLARYISESVDLKVEDDVARIILNLSEAGEDPSSGQSQGAFFMTEGFNLEDSLDVEGNEGASSRPATREHLDDLRLDADSLGSEDVDAYRCTFEEVACPIKVTGQGAKLKAQGRGAEKHDDALLLVEVSCVVDVIAIEATVTRQSMTTLFKNSPAVPVGAHFSLKSTLPSIMQADGELMKEYFGNLAQNLYLETHHMTGKNTIALHNM